MTVAAPPPHSFFGSNGPFCCNRPQVPHNHSGFAPPTALAAARALCTDFVREQTQAGQHCLAPLPLCCYMSCMCASAAFLVHLCVVVHAAAPMHAPPPAITAVKCTVELGFTPTQSAVLKVLARWQLKSQERHGPRTRSAQGKAQMGLSNIVGVRYCLDR